MGFKSVQDIHLASFNSSISSQFLDDFTTMLDNTILEKEQTMPSRTFAPSSIRCKRISWFRLRGVEPEKEVVVDRGLQFRADMGTACHHIIQSTLINSLGEDWIDVRDYLAKLNPPYKYTCEQLGFETRIEIEDPPIKFAPDGIIRYKDKLRLFEIKSSEHSSFVELKEPKPVHVDQIKCYGTLLDLPDALVLYQDRQYGDLKCYEFNITDSDMKSTWNMFDEVRRYVDMNIAPPKLPKGDPWCSPAHCRYFNKCKEW